jgi:hypothetical protein
VVGCRLARVRGEGVEDDAAEVIGMTEVLLAVGTRKGLFIGRRRGGGAWEFDETPYFNAQAVYSVAVDTRTAAPRLLVGGDSSHWGPSVFHSDDLGRTWTEPARPAVRFPKDTGASLERVWQLHPAAAEPDVVYAGTEPAALYRSEDRGETFELVRPLWEHPTRSNVSPRSSERYSAAGSVPAYTTSGSAAVRACTRCSPTRATRRR